MIDRQLFEPVGRSEGGDEINETSCDEARALITNKTKTVRHLRA